ncbi:RNA binding activity-knot of a chromodomain - like 1 [Theobroma cacao]|nr:RNA binding activity-knot of a chromodomain - like 1 [Theobroma cacao]
MGSSNTALNDDDDSATESDNDTATKTDSDSDTDSETETDEEFRKRYDTGPFREGEKVLAFHNLRIYEAKVLKFDNRSNGWHYFVHYLGWNKNWDEWVAVDRLMKFTEENRQKQEALNKTLAEEKKVEFHTSKRGTGRVFHFKLKHPKGGRGKKRKNDSISKEKSAVPSEKIVSIQLPLTLRKQLVNDCEFITHLGKLVKLPRIPTVEDILKMYLDYRSKKDGTVTDSVQEIFKGIRVYFNKALPVMLLYKSERQQYDDTITEDICPSTVYGAEHLLRLFVKLPELLVRADIEEETLLELQQKLVDFLKCELYLYSGYLVLQRTGVLSCVSFLFLSLREVHPLLGSSPGFLQKNQNTLFLSTYHVAEDVETSTNKQDN